MNSLVAISTSTPSASEAGDSALLAAFRSRAWKAFWAVSGVCLALLVTLQVALRLDVDYGV